MDANSIGIVLGIAGIVVGIAVSYYFYRKSLRIKEPCITFKHNNLIENHVSKLDGLDILYKGNKVENITVSRLLLWNEGADTINKEDIVAVNPPRISCYNNAIILEVRVLSTNNAASQFTCTISDKPNMANIVFDYIDKNQGVVIQIIHTGVSSRDIGIEGQIKGVDSIKYKDLALAEIIEFRYPLNLIINRLPLNIKRVINALIPLFIGALGLIFGSAGFYSFVIASDNKFGISNISDWIWQVMLMFGFFFGGLFFIVIGMRMVQYRPPKGLGIFDKSF